MKIFEIAMLVCFGVSWPVSIYRSVKSRTAKGKSLVFLIFIFVGYIAGILNKVVNGVDYVMVLYIINALMVFADVLLYFRNSALDKKADGKE